MNGLPNNASICYFNALIQSLISCSYMENVTNAKPILDKLVKRIGQRDNIGRGASDAHEAFVYLIDGHEDIFRGQKNVVFQCENCKKIDTKTEDYLFFPAYNEDLQDIVHKCEKIDRLCESCAHNSSLKEDFISFSPQIFIIVTFGIGDFPEWFALPKKNGRILYRLSSHIDNTGGHYICIARRENKIYTFNDMSVFESKFNINKNTTMIFYEKVDEDLNIDKKIFIMK